MVLCSVLTLSFKISYYCYCNAIESIIAFFMCLRSIREMLKKARSRRGPRAYINKESD